MILSVFPTDFYHVTNSRSCVGLAQEGSHVDLICTLGVPAECGNDTARIQWTFGAPNRRAVITNGDKYGEY